MANKNQVEEVDTRVVEMQFDNKQFEKGATQTLSTLDKLKKSLDFRNASKGFDSLQKGINAITFNPITRQLDTINGAFNTLAGSIKRNFFDAISNEILNLGKSIYRVTAGQIISGGKSRAMNIAQAKFKMEGMGVTWDQIKEDLDYAVSGTAYGLDAAANIASQLTASGVQVGDAMKTALRGVSGVAAMTSSSYEEIGNVFAAVAGQGKAMAMQLNQLSLRGINAASTIADYLGTTESAVRDMASKGQISFEIFSKAMDSAFGEHAKEANKTFTGAMSNIRAALSKVGELFYGPFYNSMIGPLNTIRETISMIKNGLVGTAEGVDTKYGMRTTAERLEQLVSILGDIANILLRGIQNGLRRALKYLRPLNRVMVSWLHNLKEIRAWLKSIVPDGTTDELNKVSESVRGITEDEKAMAKEAFDNGAVGDVEKAEKALGLAASKTSDRVEEQSQLIKDLSKGLAVVKKVFTGVAALAIYTGQRIKDVTKRIADDIYDMLHPFATASGFMEHSFRDAGNAANGFFNNVGDHTPLETLLIAVAHTIRNITELIWVAYKGLSKLAIVGVEIAKNLLGGDTLYALAGVVEFIGKLMSPEKIAKPITNIIEIIAVLARNVAVTFKAIGIAFASVFNSDTSGMIGDMTGGISNFVKTLEFTENDVANIIRIFRGFFSVIKIIIDAVGALAHGFNILTDNFENNDSVLLNVLGTFGDFFYELKNIIEETKLFERVVSDICFVLEVLFAIIEKVTNVARGDWLVEGLKGILKFVNYIAENGIIAGIKLIFDAVVIVIQGCVAFITKFPTLIGLLKDLFKGLGKVFEVLFNLIMGLGSNVEKIVKGIQKFGIAYFGMLNDLFNAVLPEGYRSPFESLTDGTAQAKNDFLTIVENAKDISENGRRMSEDLADAADFANNNLDFVAKVANAQSDNILAAAEKGAKSSEMAKKAMEVIDENVEGFKTGYEAGQEYAAQMMTSGSLMGMAVMLPTPAAIAKVSTAQSNTLENIRDTSEKTAKTAEETDKAVNKSNETSNTVINSFKSGLVNFGKAATKATFGIKKVGEQAKSISAVSKTASINEEQAIQALNILKSMTALLVSVVTTISFFKISMGIYSLGKGIGAIGSALSFVKKIAKKYQRRIVNAYIFKTFSEGLKNVTYAVAGLALTIVAMAYMLQGIGDIQWVFASLGIVGGLLLFIAAFLAILSRVNSLFGIISLGAVVATLVAATVSIVLIYGSIEGLFGKNAKKNLENTRKTLTEVAKVVGKLAGALLLFVGAYAAVTTICGKFVKNQTSKNLTRTLRSTAWLMFGLAAMVAAIGIVVNAIVKVDVDEDSYDLCIDVLTELFKFLLGFMGIIAGMVVLTTLFASINRSKNSGDSAFKDVAAVVGKVVSSVLILLASIGIIGSVVFLAKNVWANEPEKFEEFMTIMKDIANTVVDIFKMVALCIGIISLASAGMGQNENWRKSFVNITSAITIMALGMATVFGTMAFLTYILAKYDSDADEFKTVVFWSFIIFGMIAAAAVDIFKQAKMIAKVLTTTGLLMVQASMREMLGAVLILGGVASTIMLLVGALAAISKIVNLDAFKTMIWGVFFIMATIAVAAWLITEFSIKSISKKIDLDADVWLAIVATIGILAAIMIAIMATITALSLINVDPDAAMFVTGMATILMVILGVFTWIIYKISTSKFTSLDTGLTILAIAGSLSLMAFSLASVMFSLAILLKIIKESDAVNSGALMIVSAIALGIMALMAVIVLLAAWFAKKKDMSDKKLETIMLSISGSIALMCAGFAAILLALAVFANTKLNAKQLKWVLLIFGVIAIIVGGIFILITAMADTMTADKVGTAALAMITYAGAVALVCAAFSVMAFSLAAVSKVHINWANVAPLLTTFGVILVLVGLVLVGVLALSKTALSAGTIAVAMLSLGLAIAAIAVGFTIMAGALKIIGELDIADRDLEVFDHMAMTVGLMLAAVAAVAVVAALFRSGFSTAAIFIAATALMLGFTVFCWSICENLKALADDPSVIFMIENGEDIILTLLDTLKWIMIVAMGIAGLGAVVPAVGAGSLLLSFLAVAAGIAAIGVAMIAVAAGIAAIGAALRIWNGESIADIVGDFNQNQAKKMDDRTLAAWLTSGKYTGEMYAEGIKRGMVDNDGKVIAAAHELAKQADGTLRKDLGINSPSKKGYQVGTYYVEGIVNGEDEHLSLVSRETHKIAEAMDVSMQSAMDGTAVGEYYADTALDAINTTLQNGLVTANNGFGDFTFDYSSLFEDAPISPVISPVIDSKETEAAISSATDALDMSSTFEDAMGMTSLFDSESLANTLSSSITSALGVDDEDSPIGKLLKLFDDEEGGIGGKIASELDSKFGSEAIASKLSGFKDSLGLDDISGALGEDGVINKAMNKILAKFDGINSNLKKALGDGSLGGILDALGGVGDAVWELIGALDPGLYTKKQAMDSDSSNLDNIYHSKDNGWTDYIAVPGDAGYQLNIRPDD